MAGGIYVIQDNGQLVEMTETQYETEDLLQQLLAKYPSVLAGDQMDSEKPRRWLLISREMSVPDEEEGAGRWSLDHLFVDQDGIPTLVEVKRRTDTRIRREVVGQMLDYAANAVLYWSVDKLRASFEESPDDVLARFLGDESTAEAFWDSVKTNLKAGRIRMVFVADEIPIELRSIVEFLNNQMDPAVVLAVEVRQYVGPGMKALVPRLIGQTASTRARKSGVANPAVEWDQESFFVDFRRYRSPVEVKIASDILDWMKSNKLRVEWWKGGKGDQFKGVFKREDVEYAPLSVSMKGTFTIRFGELKGTPRFSDESKRLELMDKLTKINSKVEIAPDSIGHWPKVPLLALSDDADFRKFTAVLDWLINEVKS